MTEIASFPKEDTDQRSKGLSFWSKNEKWYKIIYRKIEKQTQKNFLTRNIAGEEVEMLQITVQFWNSWGPIVNSMEPLGSVIISFLKKGPFYKLYEKKILTWKARYQMM